MGLFDAPTPTPVTLTGSSTATAPQYLTDYLTQLAKAGQSQLGTTSAEGVMTPYVGADLISKLPQNLTDVYKNAPTTLSQYDTAMDESLKALRSGATGVTSADISKFYDPYQQDIIDSLEQQSALSTQRNLMPALKAAFAGQGGFGSQRYAGAMGQALADVQTGLLSNEAKLKSEGYKSALDAALKERGYDISAGQGLYGLGSAEATAGANEAKTLADLGVQELGYEQSKIDAPLTRAQNVAKILQGYTFPTSTSESKQVLPTAYAPSPLAQIGSLGSLFAAGAGGTSAAAGIAAALSGAGTAVSNWFDRINSPSITVDTSGIGLGGLNGVDTSVYGGASGPSIR